jgi:hypothetical protein
MLVTNPSHLKAMERVQSESETGFVAPEHLHEVLRRASAKIVTFRNESAMKRYRQMIYSINKQGDFRFATRRDDKSMWGVIIIRLD